MHRRTLGGRWRFACAVLAASLMSLLPLTFAPEALAAQATTISGSMEGNLPIHPGDILRAGFDVTMPGSHPAATVYVTRASVVISVVCPNKTQGSITIPIPDEVISIGLNDGAWYPSGDQKSPLVYQGSVTAPNLCGGATMHAPKGAVFTADFASTDVANSLHVRFHYSDYTENTSGSWSGTAQALLSRVFSGSLYFTSWQNQGTCSGSGCTTNVWKTTWTYDGSGTASGLSIATPTALPTTQGADGIAFMPSNGNLLIGGQFSDKVFEVNPTTDAISAVIHGVSPQSVSGGVYGYGAFHLTVGPSGQHVWTSGFGSPAANGGLGGEPGPLQAVPLNPLADGTVQPLTGPDPTVTQLAFVPGETGLAWYTTGNRNGTGNLGILDVATGATTRICSAEPWGHGITYDPFTGDLLVAGSNEVVQIKPPASPSASTACSSLVVSTFSTTLPSTNGEGHFDQITVDGAGHAFAAVNTGYVYFFDYSQTRLIGTGFWTSQFLENQLDDVLTTLE